MRNATRWPASGRATLRFAACAAPLLLALTAGAQPATNATVQIVASQQQYDPFVPWQKRRPAERAGYGVCVAPGRVLTTEHLVRNATLVEFMGARAGERVPARVLLADEQVNLALLSVDEQDAAPLELRPAVLATNVARGDRLTVVQFDETRAIQSGEGQLLQIAMSTLPSAPYASLGFEVLTDQNVNGEGAPVFAAGRLAGMMMSYNPARRVGAMVPHGTVGRFLDDAAAPPYEGFASAGFLWRPLIDPATRAWLGVEQETGGILVLSCIPGAGASDALRPNDVILTWDGAAVDNLGFYGDADFGRLLFPYLIKGRRRPGETVEVSLVRGGKRLAVPVPLRKITDEPMLIPDNTTGRRDEYLVEGGLILRELTGQYLEAHGGDWQTRMDSRLVHLYLTKKLFPDQPGDRVVVLSGVLPHPINVGYQAFRDRIVTHANGKPVQAMRDVFRIRREDGRISRLTLEFNAVDIVLDGPRIDDANRDLAALYRIPALAWERNATEGETR